MLELTSNRRLFLGNTSGIAGAALASLLSAETSSAESNHFPSGKPHFPPKAKSVIWLFMRGGVSHMESFDPKPALDQYAGQTISETPFAEVQTSDKLKRVRVVVVNDANGQQRNKLYPLQIGFKPYGQSGTKVSDWFPHIGSKVDDLSIIRSMWTTDDNHGAGAVSFRPAHARPTCSYNRCVDQLWIGHLKREPTAVHLHGASIL